MDANLLTTLRALGQANAAMANASDFDAAMRDCTRSLAQAFGATFATLWSASDDADRLHPVYWLGAVDLAARTHESGHGAPGIAHATQETLRALDCGGSCDPETLTDYQGTPITSMICVPFSNNERSLGVLQLVNKDDGSHFTDEEADIAEMCATICALRRGREARLVPSRDLGAPLVEVRDVTRSYTNGDVTTQVLKGVDLSVYRGEFLVLLGESGCGKSTLLNIVAGLDSATSGQILFDGIDHAQASEHDLTAFRRKNVGMVFQSYNLLSNLDTRRNLTYISELVEDPLSVDEALELVGLSARRDMRPSQLSGGQQQRVSIARALIKRPSLILADEPTAALDYATSIEVLEALERVRDAGTTMVMVTHNEEICRMADRVVRLRDGRVHEVTVNHMPARASELVW